MESWEEKYDNLILTALSDYRNDLKTIESNVNELKVEMSILKQKVMMMTAGLTVIVSIITGVVTSIVVKKMS